MAAEPPLAMLAPAKVNLFLHVGPLDTDGYHPLASLVAFADVGDEVTVAASDRLSLTVTGPFAAGLEGPTDNNLIVRALRALGEAVGIGEPPVAVTLDKRLPIAAGLGGGSSDAGAALKATRDLLALGLDDDVLAGIAAGIGADGPMCLHARAAWADGRGDILTFEPALPTLAAILINPGLPSPTGAVYRAYDAGPLRSADHPAPPPVWTTEAVIRWLADQRNDLEAPAVSLMPGIDEALGLARCLPDVRLVRMSGSGATVFAVFDDSNAAESAAERGRMERPSWWVTAARLV